MDIERFAVENARAEFAPRMTLAEAKAEATRQAALTGERHAICDDIDGRLFVCPADQYLDQQLWTTTP